MAETEAMRRQVVFTASESHQGQSTVDDEGHESDVEDVLAAVVALDDEEDDASTTEDEEADTAPLTVYDRAARLSSAAPVLNQTLSESIRRGTLNEKRAFGAARWVDGEIQKLIGLIKQTGTQSKEGQTITTYGKLYRAASKLFWGQALNGTLKTARERGVVTYKSEILLVGISDGVTITLLKDTLEQSDPSTYTFGQIRQCSLRRLHRAASKHRASRKAAPTEVDAFQAQLDALAQAQTHLKRQFSDFNVAADDQGDDDEEEAGEPESDDTETESDGALEDVMAALVAGARAEIPDDAGGVDDSDDSDDEEPTSGSAQLSFLDEDDQLTQSLLVKAGQVPSSCSILRQSLAASIRRGELNPHRAMSAARLMDGELRRLISCIVENGHSQQDALQMTLSQLQTAVLPLCWTKENLRDILATARERGVIECDLDAVSRDVPDTNIILAEQKLEDSDVSSYTFEQARRLSRILGSRRRRHQGAPLQASTIGGALGELDANQQMGFASRIDELESENRSLKDDLAKERQLRKQLEAQVEELRRQLASSKGSSTVKGTALTTDLKTSAPVGTGSEGTAQKLGDSSSSATHLKESSSANNKPKSSQALQAEQRDTAPQPAAPASLSQGRGRTASQTAAATKSGISQLRAKAANFFAQAKQTRQAVAEPSPQEQEEAVVDVLASMSAIQRRRTIRASKRNQLSGKPATSTASTTSVDSNENESSNPIDAGLNVPDTSSVMHRRLSTSVRKGELTKRRAYAATRFVDNEIRKLIDCIVKYGQVGRDGKVSVTFGHLFESTSNVFDAVVGTLRTAKRHGVVSFGPQMLLKNVHDKEVIVLEQDDVGESQIEKYTYEDVRRCSTRRRLTSAIQNAAEPIAPPTRQPSMLGSRRRRTASRRVRPNAGAEVKSLPATSPEGKTQATTPQDTQIRPRTGMFSSPPTGQRRLSSSSSSSGLKTSVASRTALWAAKSQSSQALNAPSPASSREETQQSAGKAAPAMRKQGDPEDEEAVVDVLANLTALHRRHTLRASRRASRKNKGAGAPLEPPPSPQKATEQDPSHAALAVPEDSAVLRRRLSVSVRRGELSEKRALAAAHWVDKEIRKLIDAINRLGTKRGDKVEVSYGKLFGDTQNEFEALTGTLRTAKRHGVVSFEAETLFQGTHDHVVIALLKQDIPDSSIETYTYQQVRDVSFKKKLGSGFGNESLQTAMQSCHICKKTVYPMEFVGAADKAFHKNCFRCVTCKRKLLAGDYATVNDMYYCKVHYQQAFQGSGGSYDF